MKNSNDNIVKYPKQFHFSIGIVIIGVIFIYMLYHLFTFITADNTTIYEVSQGAISSNLEYNALAIRDETVYTANQGGHVIYLAENFSRIGVKSDIYAIDSSGSISSDLNVDSLADKNIDPHSYNKLQNTISNFVIDYDNEDFAKTYNFKNDLDSQLQQIYNVTAMSAMKKQVEAAISNGTFNIYQSPAPGLIVYSVDGLEDVSIDNLNAKLLDSSSLNVNNLKSQDKVKANAPVYKIVNSDHWNLVCEISKELYDSLKDDSYIQIEFLADEIKTWTSFELKKIDNKYCIILSLDDGMDRYADSRYVHIKLINNNITGLKIPNSSIVKKEFFTIPKNYFYQGGNSTDLGLMVQENGTNTFVSPIIYYENDDYYYIDDEKVSKGDIILKSNSNDKYTVGAETDKLQGVYNVNKGYAVFKQIEVLFQNEEYSIIKTGTNYGIAMYDHIVLQGDEVKEDMIIH